MSWKDDLKRVVETLDLVTTQLKVTIGQNALNDKRMIEVKAQLDAMQKTQARAVDRMADRMIELAMVNQGDSRSAAGHRRSLDENDHVEDTNDLWRNTGDDWPPPGCDEVRMP